MSSTNARIIQARTPQPPRDPNERRDPAYALIHALADMPMSTTDILSAAIGRKPRTTRQHLQALSNKEHVRGAYIGPDRCLWLDPSAFRQFNLTAHSCNTRRGMGILAARILPVQTIYRMAHELALIRPDTTFQWDTGRAYDAVAGRSDHWGALFWSGIWQDKVAIRRRLYDFGEDLRGEWPAILAFAVPDRWQAQILQEVLDQFHLTAHAAIWVAVADSWQLSPPTHTPRASAGWPRAPKLSPPPSLASGPNFAQFLEDRGFTGPEGAKSPTSSTIQKVQPVLEQWPAVRPTHIRDLLPKSANGAQIADALFCMKELKLATQADGVWHPGPEAATRAAHRDRVTSRRTAGKKQETLRRLRHHDWPVIKIASMFQEQGSDIAPGWRAVDDAGRAGKLDPDAMIYLHASPYGPGWHYLEYERRAQTSAAIAHKLRSCFMPERSDDWPVIFVVANEEAERLFWQHGRGLKLITAIDNGNSPPTEWHCFGVPVTLNSTGTLPSTGS